MADDNTPDTPDTTPDVPDAGGGKSWLQRHGGSIVMGVALIVSGVIGYVAKQPVPVQPQTITQTIVIKGEQNPDGTISPDPSAFGMGWVADPDEVRAVAATLPQPVFSATPAGQSADPLPKSVFGWKAYQALFGQMPPIKNQGQVGSCTSFGTNTAIERTLAAEILRRKGSKGEWSRFVEEATYGGSRVEIGGGRISGDGSVGAWAAQFVTKYGMVPRKKYDHADLSVYSESRARQWGNSGVPKEFEDIAKTFPVKAFAQVKSWDDAKRAMSQDYFIAVCSNQGFTMQRDARGICRPSGSWPHCMCVDAYYTDTDGKEYAHITNSWGPDAHTGPVGWGEPNTDGFWCDSAVVDRMIRQGDTWAFSGVTGFVRRKPLDWFIQAPRREKFRRDVFAALAF